MRHDRHPAMHPHGGQSGGVRARRQRKAVPGLYASPSFRGVLQQINLTGVGRLADHVPVDYQKPGCVLVE